MAALAPRRAMLMTSGFPISTGRLASSLNHERRRRRSKDDTDIGVDVATPEPRKANLRRSALTSNATEAQEISTLDNADLDTIICAVARVARALHACSQRVHLSDPKFRPKSAISSSINMDSGQ